MASGFLHAMAWSFLLGGVACLAGAFLAIRSSRRFLSRAVEARGRVLRLLLEQSSGSPDTMKTNRDIYRPVVVFTLPSGEEMEFTSSVAGYPPPHASGAAVTVLYDPANPKDARIRSFSEFWLGPLILGGLGLVVTPLGAFLVFSGILD